MPTILIALTLIVVGLLGTFAGALPTLAGMSSETIGAWAFVLAAALLLIGIFIEGI